MDGRTSPGRAGRATIHLRAAKRKGEKNARRLHENLIGVGGARVPVAADDRCRNVSASMSLTWMLPAVARATRAPVMP